MAQLTPFTYSLPPTPLHSRDPRLKLAALMLLSLIAMAAGTPGLLLTLLLLAAGFGYAGLPLLQTLTRLRLLLLIALFIVLSRSITLFDPGAVGVSRGGLLSGAGFAVRLLSVALLGHLFVATTSRGRIIDTLTWVCTPLPLRIRGQLPLAVSIALSTYPLIARTMLQVREACLVRGARARRNPRLTMTIVARGALDDVPRRISRIADAITVRGFSEMATPPRFRMNRSDTRLAMLLLLVGAIAFGAAAV